jgi:lincosamide nucleotidyltransferase A/C/D/E
MAEGMSPREARALYELLDQNRVRCWVMGGWGIDALLDRVTRAHKDIDLLIHLFDLPSYEEVVHSHGFERRLEWSENRQIHVAGDQFDSAFVDAHDDGREIDVHVIDIDETGALVQFHTDPWPLPADTLSGRGRIEGTTVRCVSRAAQLAMHSQYDLPERHRIDVRRLERMP